jgi:hypothetical protein
MEYVSPVVTFCPKELPVVKEKMTENRVVMITLPVRFFILFCIKSETD